jgi:hypothetical protein
MATMVVLAFHIDETRFTQSCGLIELVFGRRQASSVFMPVFLTVRICDYSMAAA